MAGIVNNGFGHNGFCTLPLHVSNSEDVDLTCYDGYVSVWYSVLPD